MGWIYFRTSVAADYYVIKSFDLSELKAKIALALNAGGHHGT
jgi:DNA-binding response OmpR family regulator